MGSLPQKERLVVDVDAHYFENPRAFAKYLDEPWKIRLENWTGKYFGPPAALADSIDRYVGGRIDHREGIGLPNLDRPEVIEPIMKYLDVDVAVLLPGTLLSIGEITEKARAVALCRGYIEYMLEEVVNPAKGIYTLIMACNQSPPDAARMIDHFAQHDGVCGVGMMTDGLVLPCGDSYYDPIYEACLRNDLPLVLHSGFGGSEGHESGLGLQSYIENHLAFVVNNQKQLTSFVMQGTPERFPGLKVLWQEAGVFWIPSVMYRLDMDYSMLRSQVPLLKKPPSEYIKEMYFGTQPLERVPKMEYMKAIFDMIDGENRLMFATDWPHRDFDHPVVIDRLTFLDEQGKRNILGDNARRVLRFRQFGRLEEELGA